MNKILIVGSTGKIGHVLVEELAKAGEQLRAATRNPSKMTTPKGVEPVLFDYADPSTFAPALEGTNRVFVLAPQDPNDMDPTKFLLPFLEVAAKNQRKIVLLSSASVEFEGTEPLRQVEQALKQSGSPFVVLRPNWFMDNFHTLWIEGIHQANVLPLPAGDSHCSFVDTRDVAASAAVALRTDRFNGRILTLTGPKAITHEEVAAILSNVSGRKIDYIPLDDASFIKSLTDVGLPTGFADYITWLFQGTRNGSAAMISPHIEELTGRAPRSFEQYAQDYAAAWK